MKFILVTSFYSKSLGLLLQGTDRKKGEGRAGAMGKGQWACLSVQESGSSCSELGRRGLSQFLLVISHVNAALHRGFLSPAGTFISRVPC